MCLHKNESTFISDISVYLSVYVGHCKIFKKKKSVYCKKSIYLSINEKEIPTPCVEPHHHQGATRCPPTHTHPAGRSTTNGDSSRVEVTRRRQQTLILLSDRWVEVGQQEKRAHVSVRLESDRHGTQSVALI